MNTSPGYQLTGILPADEGLLMKEVFLVILNANRIPPHLAVSVNGNLFSLSVQGVTVNGSLTSLLSLIHKKKIQTLFIRLAVPPIVSIDQLKHEMMKFTLSYEKVVIGKSTCLNPIRDFCSSIYDINIQDVNFIFDLLPKLYQHNAIHDCYQLYMSNTMLNQSFILNHYSINEVNKAIHQATSNQLN